MSDRSRYAQLPQSRPSTSSFRSVSLSSPPANTADHPPRQSSFLFSSLSSVWSGLKAAAGVQAEGFWRGVGASGVGEAANVGEKRERADDGAEGAKRSDRDRKGKRRRMEEQHLAVEGDFLFDGVPPLMPPISHASPMPNRTTYASSSSHFSSSPVELRSALPPTSSPEARRRALRPYADQQGHDYEETLMHAVSSAESILPTGTEPAPSRRSFASPDGQSGLPSLSGRRKVSVQGIPAAPEASTSALAGRGYKHSRAQSSHAYSAGYYAPLSTGVPLPNPRHVHFAPIPSLPGSTSLPNLASIAGSAPTSREASKSPKTPRRSAPSPSSRSTSSSSAKKGKSPKPTTPQVASVLFGNDMAQVWSTAKQEEAARKREEEERRVREGRERETQERREKRIRELEEEVGRLKGELSAKKEPASFPKSPRASFPPAPPPPPPPPVGRPHPLLLSIRQSLKATPPRPSQSNASKQKRRLSTLGGEGSAVDMGAFLEELGGRRGKLRKVGLPEMRKREGGKGGELEDVLLSDRLQPPAERAFARKFAHTASPSTPRLASSRSNLDFRTLDRDVKKPEWTSPRPSASTSGLTHSVSHPVGLAELAAVPPQPVFHPSSSSSSRPPPRSSSLAVPSTETTVFGTALSTDLPAPSLPAPVPVSASISPSLSTDSLAALTSAPPELPMSSVAAGAATPARPATPDEAASQRLSSARRRSGDGSPLPGLEMGRRRPMTPGRARGTTPAFKDIQPPASSTSTSKTPRKSPSSAAAATAKKRKAATPKTPREERYEEFEEEVLYSGQGGKEPEPGRVFGRA
ncbi:hypothetical protein JCM8097_004382 [Rhodosporidiobolus ruineniae]